MWNAAVKNPYWIVKNIQLLEMCVIELKALLSYTGQTMKEIG